MNKVILMGNLGEDPELRHTATGNPVLKLRLATTRRYKDKDGEWKDAGEWHNVIVWGKRGEALERILSKGSKILVEGEMRTSSYEVEGQKRYRTEVVANEIELAGGKGDGGGSSGGSRRDSGDAGNRGRSSGYDDRDYGGGGDDDIPF